jgi:hypothetical protein
MSDKQEPKKKKPTPAETPVHTIRTGAITASIWRRQSPSGFVYFDYSLARNFQSLSSGSAGSSRNFFAQNRQEIIEAVEQASRWIDEHEAGVGSRAA